MGLSDIIRELKDTRQQVNEKIDTLGEKMEERCTRLENDLELLRAEITRTKEEKDEVKQKLDDLENRSRKNSIVFHGIREKVGETWEDTEKTLCYTLSEKLNIAVDDGYFERAHRVGKPNVKGRPIITLCSSYKKKVRLMKISKEKKPEGLYANEDYSETVRQARRKLTEVMKKKRDLGFTAFLSYNKLIVKNSLGKQNIYMVDMATQTVMRVRRSFDDAIRSYAAVAEPNGDSQTEVNDRAAME